MKTYAHPEELQQAPPEIREHLAAIVGDEGDSLEYALGGPVCIVEDLGDLERAVTTTPSWVNTGNWASVLESPGAVDSVQWIGDHLEFLRRQHQMFYYKGTQECDFILQEGKRPSEAWQVCWEVTPQNEQRELKGLFEAMSHHKIPKGGILTYDQEGVRTVNGKSVSMTPVWKWLLVP